MVLNINTDSSIIFTNKLEKLHKSGLPVAIRGALNKAAFDVKKDTMPKTASRTFKNRQPNFFKANSRVEMAKGFDTKTMIATVGFVEGGLKGGNNFAVKDLEQQEEGGTIKGRSFIPTNVARGGSNSKAVRPGNRITAIKRIVNAKNGRGKSRKQKFINSAILAGAGGYVLGNLDKKILWRIDSIKKTKRGTEIRKKALYSFKDKRSVKVSATGFMKRASLESASKIEEFYIQEAKKQIERLTK